MGKITRSFSVRAYKEALVADLPNKLDKELRNLQLNGWEIKDVITTPCKEWDYPKYFDSIVYTIIAVADVE